MTEPNSRTLRSDSKQARFDDEQKGGQRSKQPKRRWAKDREPQSGGERFGNGSRDQVDEV